MDAADLRRRFAGTPLAPCLPALLDAVVARGHALRHGDLPRWRAALDALPTGAEPEVRVEGPVVVADGRGPDRGPDRSPDRDAGPGGLDRRASLQVLHPWRKGPLRIDGVDVDTEWRSDMKWDRVVPHLAPLAGRCVLDVGCGSGYHLWRMRDAGCAAALGIEPTLLYVCQFELLARRAPGAPVACLPLTLEALVAGLRTAGFDTVFSMGVLYHRRDPRAHLTELRSLLRPGGELVLETIVADRARDVPWPTATLDPRRAPPGRSADPDESVRGGRYARMSNVYPLPSVASLEGQLLAAGFETVRTVSLEITTTAEQRRTDWMRFDSLEQALEPLAPGASADDPDRRTVEGLPRPARAVLVARAAAPS